MYDDDSFYHVRYDMYVLTQIHILHVLLVLPSLPCEYKINGYDYLFYAKCIKFLFSQKVQRKISQAQ